jgi:asparagine synthase (glutamine-hydrolysing)
MLAAMRHDAQYQSGTYFAPEQGIYTAWTAHAGSDVSARVHHDVVRGVSVVFSGELVPTDEALSTGDRGVSCDAARLAALFSASGPSMIDRLNGLFSAVVIDSSSGRSFLFNDRYGLERIYYYETNDATFFASEAKALLRVAPEVRALDDESVAEYLAIGCTTGSRTLFRGVRLLEGGSIWTFDGTGIRKSRYFTPESWERLPQMGGDEFQSAFEDTFTRILPCHFDARSRIGISLTGGLDTRMIMACLPATACPPICYTFSAQSHSTVDEVLAARVATACGLEHHVLRIGDEFLSDYGSWVDRTVYATDACGWASVAHEPYLNALARELSPIRMTGNFGSEVLRSVSQFKPLDLLPELFEPELAGRIANAGRNLRNNVEQPVTFAAFREIPWKLFGTLAAARALITFRTPYLDNRIVELAFRAPPSMRRSASSALRLIQNHGSRTLNRIPTAMGMIGDGQGVLNRTRWILHKVSSKLDYLYQEGVPRGFARLEPLVNALSERGKRHRYLPYRHWFRKELADHVKHVLTDPQTMRLPYWNRETLERIARDHSAGRENYVREIEAVLTCEAIDRLLIRGSRS